MERIPAGAAECRPEVRPSRNPDRSLPWRAGVEDRWIVSRLQRAVEAATASIDSYDFAHAALDLYGFFWSELCDWYLEIVKPRLYDGDPKPAATLLWVLEQTLALPTR